MGPALVGRLIDFLGRLRLGLDDQAHVLEHRQGRIDDAGARRIMALGHLLDRLDQLIAVARLIGDQLEQHEAKFAALEHPFAGPASAPAAPAAAARPTVSVKVEIERAEPERTAAPAREPAAMIAALIMKMHLLLLLD